MGKRTGYGRGRVYKHKYLDKTTGEWRETDTYYVRYSVTVNGKNVQKRESTGTKDWARANEILAERQAGLVPVEPAPPTKPTIDIDTVLGWVEHHYTTEGLRSLRTLKLSRFPHLRRHFAGEDLSDVPWTRILKYREDRLREKPKRRGGKRPANGTINREHAVLAKALRLGAERGLVRSVPTGRKMKEATPRSGFFEQDVFDAILAHVQDFWKPLYETAYITGWRADSALMTLRWTNINWDDDHGVLRLNAMESKSEEPVEFPLTKNLRRVLLKQRENITALEAAKGRKIPWVFPGVDGHQIKSAYHPWKDACIAAEHPKAIVHDFRRTAVRNLTLAGIERKVAKQMVGMKTESVWIRYNIVSAGDRQLGRDQLNAFEDRENTKRAQREVR